MTVAAFDEGKWYRVEVLCITGREAFVLFADWGCRKYVKICNLRFLEKTFAIPSRKSCKGTLSGVKPKNGEKLWDVQTIMRFMEKTKGKKVSALVKGFNDDGFYVVSLIEKETKVKISDYLISEDLADAHIEDEYLMNAILVRNFNFVLFKHS
jgi:hypothetical protein